MCVMFLVCVVFVSWFAQTYFSVNCISVLFYDTGNIRCHVYIISDNKAEAVVNLQKSISFLSPNVYMP